jgi:hypothetical protein
MPLVRKLLIFAAVDGLVLQPRSSHPHAQQQQGIKIDYKGNVGPLLNSNHEGDDTLSSLESHGIVGMSTSFAHTAPAVWGLMRNRASKSSYFNLPDIDLRSRTSRTNTRQAHI